MNSTPVHGPRMLASLGCACIFFTGCATTSSEPPPEAKIVDGNQYVTVAPSVGSHMIQRVRVSDLNQPGIAPTKTGVVTPETDTTILPATAGEITGSSAAPRGGP